MIHLPRVLAAAGDVQRFCQHQQWRFCFNCASAWTWTPDDSLITCSAEDLIVHKAFAGRDLDWSDVERILTRQYGKLNLAQIRAELTPLLELKDEPEAMAKLEQKIETVDRRLRAQP